MKMAFAVQLLLCLCAVFIGRAQGQCSLSQLEDMLGPTDMESSGGLVSSSLVAGTQGSTPPPVQVFQYNIVCRIASQTRDRYNGVSVVVNYTCTGVPSECTTAANDGFVVSQFEFSCSGSNMWSLTVAGSSTGNVITPSDANLTTAQQTNCALCVNPRRGQGTPDPVAHCQECTPDCNVGLMQCTGGGDDRCCSYYRGDMCVAECPGPERPTDENICSIFCDPLPDQLANGSVSFSSGSDQGSIATYSCDVGFNLVPMDGETRTCVADDQQNITMWNSTEPVCQIVECPNNLTNPTNGAVSLDAGTMFNSTATYVCDGTSDLTPPNGGTRRCQADGTWSGNPPICKCKSGYKQGDTSGKCELIQDGGLKPGEIAGIAIGAFVIVIIVIVVIVLVAILIVKSQANRKPQVQEETKAI